MSAQPLRIDLVSDVVCPWCVIGYYHLDQALQTMTDEISADIHWHPFQLNPGMPVEGQNLFEHIQQKYGSSREDAQAMRDRITALGAEAGFEFNFRDDHRAYNTFDAHRGIHWAGTHNRGTEMSQALFQAYFTQARNPSDPEVLASAANQIGLDGEELLGILASDRFTDEVKAGLKEAQQLGISGVPTFILNRKYSLTGGQPVDVFRQALRQIANETQA